MAFTCLIEFEPRGQQRLQRAVMKVLGDFAAVTPVGLHCLRKQLTGYLLQRLHPREPRLLRFLRVGSRREGARPGRYSENPAH